MLRLASVAALVPQGAPAEPDWTAIGLVLTVVGSFLLGNAILFRHPRALIEEYFGGGGKRRTRLPAIREHVFHRAQIAVGFTYLVAGFGVQLLGRYRPVAPLEERPFPVAWIGAVVVLTIGLLGASWWWAKHSFRRHVREHLRREAPDFEADLRLAREVGDLFGVLASDDDTVQSYLERLHRELRMTPPVWRGKREMPLSRLEDLEVEEGA